jgi:REP element-mobilizing transposase RayT
MARIARIVAANLPHHITQRGNRRQKTFFQDEDYRLYRSLMAEWCNNHIVEVSKTWPKDKGQGELSMVSPELGRIVD